MTRKLTAVVTLLLVSVFAWGTIGAYAASSQVVSTTEVEYVFGEEIIISGSLLNPAEVASASVFLRSDRSSTTVVGEAEIVDGQVIYTHDLDEKFVPPFSVVTYWFVVTSPSGAVTESERFTFIYEDNRFDWQTLESSPFRIHWYDGNVGFAQSVMDVAHLGYEKIADWLPVKIEDAIDIYLYATDADYQYAQGNLNPQWAGGHANPAFNIILVAIPTDFDQQLRIERTIPHEISHVMVYQYVPGGYQNIPTWLNEGIATNMELYSIPEYAVLLESAYKQGSLLPFTRLCNPFSQETSEALLSYAQSASMVRFLRDTYGNNGIQSVIRAYADGSSCVQGPAAAPINADLNELDTKWKSWAFNDSPFTQKLLQNLPILLLSSLPLVGLGVLLLWMLRRPSDEPGATSLTARPK